MSNSQTLTQQSDRSKISVRRIKNVTGRKSKKNLSDEQEIEHLCRPVKISSDLKDSVQKAVILRGRGVTRTRTTQSTYLTRLKQKNTAANDDIVNICSNEHRNEKLNSGDSSSEYVPTDEESEDSDTNSGYTSDSSNNRKRVRFFNEISN